MALLVALLSGGPAQADGEGEWRKAIHLYPLGETIEGTCGIGPLDSDVQVDRDTVFDSLEGAFLGMYIAQHGPAIGWRHRF